MAGTEPTTRTGLRSWWTGEGVRWTIVTLLIPFAGLVWNEVQERDIDRQKRLEKVRAEEQTRVINARSESDSVIKLMPALSSDDASPTRGIALAVLLNLSSRAALSPELASSVQVAIDSSQQRLREGKATEGERAALSKIAQATDRDSSRGDAAKIPPGERPRAGGGDRLPSARPRHPQRRRAVRRRQGAAWSDRGLVPQAKRLVWSIVVTVLAVQSHPSSRGWHRMRSGVGLAVAWRRTMTVCD